MRLAEKLEYIQENHFGDWVDMRRKVDNELSDKQAMFCLCGRLATGLHERSCRRFNNKVNSETIKRLAHLLPAKGVKV